MKLRTTRPEDPCVCGSARALRDCCGSLVKGPYVAVYVGGADRACRFLVAHVTRLEALCADDGRVLVYSNRAQALARAMREGGGYGVLGMSESKWESFQRAQPHLLVPEAQA